VQVIRSGVVGGPRSSAYIKQVADAETVGAELCAGATLALWACRAGQLAETHTPLDDLLGGVTEAWCDELRALPSAAQRAALRGAACQPAARAGAAPGGAPRPCALLGAPTRPA
jgi:hypothetical protein